MEQGPNSLSAFMRGGQYLAHIANMMVQNIFRGLALVAVLAFIIGSYFYVKKLDGYDKYVIAIEVGAVTRAVIPLADEDNETHFIDLYGPLQPNQNYQKVLLKERRLVPWYEAERYKTMKKLKAASWLTFFDSLILLLLLSALSSTLGRIITKDKQTRGARIVTKRELIREVRAYNKEAAATTNMKHYRPYEIADIEYPLRSETQHTLVVGSTGVGKTQLLLRLLKQVHDRNDRAIIYDKMRSFVPMFFNAETDYILNPLDNRCPPWDIFSDARNIVEWNSIADSLVQSDKEGDYWSQGAKSIFASTANRLQQECARMQKRPRMTDLLYLLTQTNVDELHDFLKGTEAARHINPAADKQSASMLSTLAQSLTCLGFLKDSTEDNPGFSIRRWMADDTLKGKLFLTSRDDQHATIQPLLTMWMSLCTTSLMSQQRSNNRLCWFFLDELPSLNRLPDLEAGLAQARQYGGAYVIGIQLESQLQKTYDEKGAQTIMGLTLNKAIFNPGDPGTAKVMADAIGKKELMRRNEGISLGANRIRDGVSVNSQITQEHIVLPEELMSLPNLNFYLKMRGSLPCAKMELKYQPIQEHHQGYIEDMYFMTRYDHKMSGANSAQAAKDIINHIAKTKGAEPRNPASHPVSAPEQHRPIDTLTPVAVTGATTESRKMMTVDALSNKPVAPQDDMRSPAYVSVQTVSNDENAPSSDFLNSLEYEEPAIDYDSIYKDEGQSLSTENSEQPEQKDPIASDPSEGDAPVLFNFDADDEPPEDDSDEQNINQQQRHTRKIPKEIEAQKEDEIAPPPKKEPELTKAEMEKARLSTRVHNQKSREGGPPEDRNAPAGRFGGQFDRGR